jgi:hypothetical protein
MNAKANSIGMVPALIVADRIQGLDRPAASFALAHAVLKEDSASSPEPGLFLGLSAVEHGAEEFWETLSYLTIWICGLSGIGLCFV